MRGSTDRLTASLSAGNFIRLFDVAAQPGCPSRWASARLMIEGEATASISCSLSDRLTDSSEVKLSACRLNQIFGKA